MAENKGVSLGNPGVMDPHTILIKISPCLVSLSWIFLLSGGFVMEITFILCPSQKMPGSFKVYPLDTRYEMRSFKKNITKRLSPPTDPSNERSYYLSTFPYLLVIFASPILWCGSATEKFSQLHTTPKDRVKG